MDYRSMSSEELKKVHLHFVMTGNMNAAREIREFQEFFGKRIKVVKGRKVSHNTEGVIFWLKRYDNSKYGDPWGIKSSTKIGFKDDNGNTFFTALDNVEIIAE